MIDTLRILVDWKCNLACSYCCNRQPAIRAGIQAATLESIDFARYRTICITGGEPLLFPERIESICQRAPAAFKVLSTNGLLLTRDMGQRLAAAGIDAVNVGLHLPITFSTLIERSRRNWPGRLRFNVESVFAVLVRKHQDLEFHFWKRDDCERPNEERVILAA